MVTAAHLARSFTAAAQISSIAQSNSKYQLFEILVISLTGKVTFFLFNHGPSQEAQTKPHYFSFPQAEGVQVSVTQTVSGHDYYALSETVISLHICKSKNALTLD